MQFFFQLDSFTIEENETVTNEVFYSPLKENEKYGIDPRSPTSAFWRTPILLNTSKNNLFLNNSDDNFEIYNSPIAANTISLGIDPRSPTREFVRTPIVINTSNDNFVKILHNKNLDKAIRSEIFTSIKKSNKAAPKLLESSPIKCRIEAYKRKSFVGLLETNIDFTETDIDAVLKEKCRIKENTVEEFALTSEVNDNNSVPENNILANKPVLDNQDKYELNEVIDIIVDIDGKDQEYEITKDLLPKEVVSEHENKEYINEMQSDEKIIIEVIQEIKSAPLTLKKESIDPKSVSVSKSAPGTPPLVNITTDVKELDKKLTNLIYEDQDIVVCPRIVQLKDILERSPMKNRNGTELELKKSAQKLRVSDKPRKSEYNVSKIPVFKTKVSKGKIQCENTPPRNVEQKSRMGKKSQWDSNDVTLYI